MGVQIDVRGKGPAVVLIHGFPLNATIWNDTATFLSADLTTFTLDLPGFGSSSNPPENFTIDDVANHVADALVKQGIEKATFVGHSLGGYVALAITALHPEMTDKLVLLHSTAFADSAEKKANRDKVITFIEENGVIKFTSNFITPLFANPAHPFIPAIREIAMQASEFAVTGYTKAMRNRPDRSGVLKNFQRPILVIGGENDSVINPESLKQLAALSPKIKLEMLSNTGHMGMTEAPKETAKIIRAFVLRK